MRPKVPDDHRPAAALARPVRRASRQAAASGAALCLLLLLAAPTAAQDSPDPDSTARFHLGALAFTPSGSVTNVGVDTNVFNTWDDPKQDFTATVSPRADWWFRVGKAAFSARTSLAYVYFGHYASERSVNADLLGRLEARFPKVRPYVAFSYLTTRDRPGFEIDSRARRSERGVTAGVDLPLAWRLALGVSARRTRIAYAADALFLGTYLRDVFDRTVQSVQATARYRATPLTTLVLRAETERQSFTFSPLRDATGVRVMPGIEFGAFAIVQGTAYVGYRRLNMHAAGMPDYSGPVAAVTLGHTLLRRLRVEVSGERDVYYSYEASQPFYVLTGALLTLTARLHDPWDVQARGALQHLAYRATGARPDADGRVDEIGLFGLGIGYRINARLRLGFNLDSVSRHSITSQHAYRGLRGGSSITYVLGGQ